jgi:hypothetical protein
MLSPYNKSIRCLVDRMSEATYSSELGLVICLLFVCIEFLQGNYHTGLVHMRGGFRLISAHRQSPTNCSADEDLLQVVPSGSARTLNSVEETLISIFIHGMAQALLYSLKAHEDVEVPNPMPACNMRFDSLSQAPQAYSELRNASIIHLYTIGLKFISRQKPSITLHQERHYLLACHYMWYESMERFELDHKPADEDIVATSTLGSWYYATFVYVSCSATVVEKTYDTFLDHLKKIVQYARVVHRFDPACEQQHGPIYLLHCNNPTTVLCRNTMSLSEHST